MSTMVNLTAGVSCSEIGITEQDCNSQLTKSVTSATKLRQPQLRNVMLEKFQSGGFVKSFLHKRTSTHWNPNVNRRYATKDRPYTSNHLAKSHYGGRLNSNSSQASMKSG